MKFELTIDVDLPRDRVLALFDDPDNLKKWMTGLEEFEVIEGEPGQPGSRSRFRFRMGKRDVEIIETITVRDLPLEFSGTYETAGMWSFVQNLFEETSPDQTLWITRHEFRSRGFTRLLMWLMPAAFKKQALQHMKDFKAFAETQS